MSTPDTLLLLLTGACFVALVVAARLPVSLSLAAASVVLALAAGKGFPLAHLVEGMFSYLDVSLVILTAMVFMKVIEANGLLAELTQSLIALLGRSRLLLLVALTIVIMFPGMITGSCTASVLGTGAIVAPVLMRMGLPRVTTGAVISSAAVYGMIAPPVNVPVMIIGGGIDMPYVGFGLVLAVFTIVPAILTTIWLAWRGIEPAKLAEVVAAEPGGPPRQRLPRRPPPAALPAAGRGDRPDGGAQELPAVVSGSAPAAHLPDRQPARHVHGASRAAAVRRPWRRERNPARWSASSSASAC